jgi:hypothetical protein
MHTEAIQVTPATLYLPQFGLEVPVLRVSGMGDYFPVRQFCTAIGLNSRPQVEKIQTDSSYEDGRETFTVDTPGGPQESVCLRKKELAWWLANLEPRTVRKLEARFGIPLGDFKQAVMHAADALWWSAPASSGHGELAPINHGAIYLQCRRCKALHKLALSGDHFSWEIAKEQE